MASLPAYSGPDGPCLKCGVAKTMTTWHGSALACYRAGKEGVDGEHLCRRCENCGYGWIEACAGEPPPLSGR